jgi:hypothetical protein
MAPLQQVEEDAIATQVLQQLSRTPYACSSLTQQSTRPGNFVYRGVLAQPLAIQDVATAGSIIIKHSTNAPLDAMRCVIMDPSPYHNPRGIFFIQLSWAEPER